MKSQTKESNKMTGKSKLAVALGSWIVLIGLASDIVAGRKPEPPALFLDVIFDGTWGFVQKSDGKIEALTPDVQGHTPPYFRAINEGQFKKGVNYELKMKNAAGQTIDMMPPAELADLRYYSQLSNKPIDIDKQNEAYVSITFPAPNKIVASHVDLACLQSGNVAAVTCDDKSSKQYATSVALRFAVADFSGIALHPDSGGDTKIGVPELGSEGILRISTGPDDLDPDHDHAKRAFSQLVHLFSPAQCAVSFPAGQETKIMHDNIKILNISGLDCLPPNLIVPCSATLPCNFNGGK
jgi:hypothetical protein